MKWISLFLVLLLLTGCGTGIVADTSVAGPDTSMEKVDAWLLEQTSYAETFCTEHQELLDDIAAQIMETDLANQYTAFYIEPFHDEQWLMGYCRSDGTTDEINVLSVSDLSMELSDLLKVLNALRPMALNYTSQEYDEARTLTFNFSSAVLSGNYFCNVNLTYQPKRNAPEEWEWQVTQEEFCMDGI